MTEDESMVVAVPGGVWVTLPDGRGQVFQNSTTVGMVRLYPDQKMAFGHVAGFSWIWVSAIGRGGSCEDLVV